MVSTYVCFCLKGVYYVYVYMRMNAKCRENIELYSHGPYPAAYVSFSGIRITVARLTIFCLFFVFFSWAESTFTFLHKGRPTTRTNGNDIALRNKKRDWFVS